MGIEITRQILDLGKSVLLGVGFALLYDALRALRLLRRRQRSFTTLADILYCAIVAAAMVSFTLNIGGGELRLFMIFGALGGAAASFILLSPLLRALWSLWAEGLVLLWRLCSMECCDVAYLYPLADGGSHRLVDALLRLPLRMNKNRDKPLCGRNRRRQA